MIQNWYTQADAEKWMTQAGDRTADRGACAAGLYFSTDWSKS